MTDPLTVHTDHPEAVYGISHISLSPEEVTTWAGLT
jgi:hypothetical protein